jgi:hypothetical protein
MVRLAGGWRKVHNRALHNLFSSQLFSGTVIKVPKISGRISEVKKPPEDLGVDENIKMIFKETMKNQDSIAGIVTRLQAG